MRTTPKLTALLASAALLIAACSTGGSPSPSASASASAEPSSAAPSQEPSASPSESTGAIDFQACEVSDTGGIDDKGFNQNAYKGLTDAQAELGIEPKFLESTAETDYERNIQTFIDEGCEIIVTVGFLLGDATGAAADANPDQRFAIVDFAYDPAKPNVLGIVFKMDEPSFLAGYLAAAMSKTGKVGTFGGIQIPPVVEFMDGFYGGVQYHNEVNGTNVTVLGWDPAADTGAFTGDFSDTAKGRQQAEAFLQEGADVIFPVAGPVGLGAAAAVQDAKKGGAEVYFIGVDVDQYESAPEYADIMLSSVLKRIDNGVKNAIAAAVDDSFEGGVSVNTLANEGTGLAPFHDFEDAVPAEVKTALEDLQAKIISGEVVPGTYYGAGG